MNKSTFIKWLPIEGEIEDGDNYLSLKNLEVCISKFDSRPNKGDMKAKQYLCSGDIKLGDYVHFEADAHSIVMFEKPLLVVDDNQVGPLTGWWCNISMTYQKYKIIREITSDE